MEGKNGELPSEVREKVVYLFKESMTRLAKFEELADEGNKLLNGYRQGLEFLRRPPIKKSNLVKKIIKSNETKRMKSYFGEKSKSIKTSDANDNINKLNACHGGLRHHLTRAKALVTELELLVEDTCTTLQCTNEASIQLYKDASNLLAEDAASAHQEGSVSSLSHVGKSEDAEHALMTGIIYTMVKQEFTMQDMIVTSLSFKLSSEELENYCLMWSLRPNINEEVMRIAWKLIP